MGRFEIRDRIGRLDPERDYAEIYRLMVFYEYPWDLRMVGKTMIWHLYAVPSTASVVGSTDDLTNRAEETSLVFGELIEHGLDSARGRATLRMINRSHRGWPISDEDHRYALAALAVTAIRWLAPWLGSSFEAHGASLGVGTTGASRRRTSAPRPCSSTPSSAAGSGCPTCPAAIPRSPITSPSANAIA